MMVNYEQYNQNISTPFIKRKTMDKLIEGKKYMLNTSITLSADGRHDEIKHATLVKKYSNYALFDYGPYKECFTYFELATTVLQ